MIQVINYIQQAEFALAAYATGLTFVAPNKTKLVDAGFSAAQAVRFSSTYTVIQQYNDSNGLSATVFADASGNNYLSIRGTEPSALDLAANGLLALGLPAWLTAQGNDVIVGGTASITQQTFLSSGIEQTLAEAIAAGEVQAATGRSVYMLAGNIGGDWIVGAGDDDALFGGKENAFFGLTGGTLISRLAVRSATSETRIAA